MQMQASANFRIHWQTGYVHHPFPKSLPTVERVLKVEMRNVTGGRHANNENFNSIAYYGSRSSEIQHVGWFQWNFPVDVIRFNLPDRSLCFANLTLSPPWKNDRFAVNYENKRTTRNRYTFNFVFSCCSRGLFFVS